jgi:cysteinyl-tRNA synthetase
MNFTRDALGAAERTLVRWRRHVAEWSAQHATDSDVSGWEKRFVAAISDDLDTPTVMALVSEVFADQAVPPGDRAALLTRWDAFLGLDLARDVGRQIEVPGAVAELVEQRERARTKQDWSTADRLRHKILSLGFEVEDTPDGPKPRPRAR